MLCKMVNFEGWLTDIKALRRWRRGEGETEIIGKITGKTSLLCKGSAKTQINENYNINKTTTEFSKLCIVPLIKEM